MRDANVAFLCGEFLYREEREERKGKTWIDTRTAPVTRE